MPMQFSNDLGESWTQENSPFPGIRGGQKAAALKLQSKALLLISMDNKGTVVGKGETFAAVGKVANVRPNTSMGIVFTGIEEDAQTVLEKWVAELREHQ